MQTSYDTDLKLLLTNRRGVKSKANIILAKPRVWALELRQTFVIYILSTISGDWPIVYMQPIEILTIPKAHHNLNNLLFKIKNLLIVKLGK